MLYANGVDVAFYGPGCALTVFLRVGGFGRGERMVHGNWSEGESSLLVS